MEKEEIEVGKQVIYWAVIEEGSKRFDPLKTVIISESWELGNGIPICKIAGISGGVSIEHLDLITPGSLMAAKLSGLKEISNDDIKEATEKYFTDKGVKVTVN